MPERPLANPHRGGDAIFGGVLGGLLALALLKFGNPIILADFGNYLRLPGIPDPSGPHGLLELIFEPWPLALAYYLLIVVSAAAVKVWRWQTAAPRMFVLLPLGWMVWQLFAAVDTVDRSLTWITLRHFASCVLCFYLGVFALANVKRLGPFRSVLISGFCGMLSVGWYQHFVGFAETRQFFYELPNWRDFPSSFLDKLGSDRIYGTLFYPNALAGAIILLLPFVLISLWEMTREWEREARLVLLALVALGSLACLYWSESKAGWLITLILLLIVFVHVPVSKKVQLTVLSVVLVIGLATFFAKYSNYFARGATSVVARFDYWRAAVQVVRDHPLTGSGPGTFMTQYRKRKHPKAEMTRLAHNDYLQQASDSGLIGFITYTAFALGSVYALYPGRQMRRDLTAWALWLGILGFSLQEFVEFGLYIPATSWCHFLFLGWLWERSRRAQREPEQNPRPLGSSVGARP